MSATGRGAERRQADQYMTPYDAIESLLFSENCPDFIRQSRTILEPCAGDCGSLRKISECLPNAKVRGIELDPLIIPKDVTECVQGNFMDMKLPVPGSIDLCMTNPPFGYIDDAGNDVSWMDFFVRMEKFSERGVVLLLRLNVFGSLSRKDFWNTNPASHVLVLASRPKFWEPGRVKRVGSIDKKTGKFKPGTDACEYAWFCWDKNATYDGTIIKVI